MVIRLNFFLSGLFGTTRTAIIAMVFLGLSGCASLQRNPAMYDGPERPDDEIATVMGITLYGEYFRQRGIIQTSAWTEISGIYNEKTKKLNKGSHMNLAKLLPGKYRIYVEVHIQWSAAGMMSTITSKQLVKLSLEKGYVYAIRPEISSIQKNTFLGSEVKTIKSAKVKLFAEKLGLVEHIERYKADYKFKRWPVM